MIVIEDFHTTPGIHCLRALKARVLHSPCSEAFLSLVLSYRILDFSNAITSIPILHFLLQFKINVKYQTMEMPIRSWELFDINLTFQKGHIGTRLDVRVTSQYDVRRNFKPLWMSLRST